MAIHGKKAVIDLTTAVGGAASAYTHALTGKIAQITYVKDGSNGFANGVDFDVTVETTGQVVWDQDNVNATATVAPRQPTHTTAGVAATLDGTVAALDKIALAEERLLISVANGGDGKAGRFVIVLE